MQGCVVVWHNTTGRKSLFVSELSLESAWGSVLKNAFSRGTFVLPHWYSLHTALFQRTRATLAYITVCLNNIKTYLSLNLEQLCASDLRFISNYKSPVETLIFDLSRSTYCGIKYWNYTVSTKQIGCYEFLIYDCLKFLCCKFFLTFDL